MNISPKQKLFYSLRETRAPMHAGCFRLNGFFGLDLKVPRLFPTGRPVDRLLASISLHAPSVGSLSVLYNKKRLVDAYLGYYIERILGLSSKHRRYSCRFNPADKSLFRRYRTRRFFYWVVARNLFYGGLKRPVPYSRAGLSNHYRLVRIKALPGSNKHADPRLTFFFLLLLFYLVVSRRDKKYNKISLYLSRKCHN